jgi:hypothetical protein
MSTEMWLNDGRQLLPAKRLEMEPDADEPSQLQWRAVKRTSLAN